MVTEVINNLNEQTDRNFCNDCSSTRKELEYQIKKGYVFDDFKLVIDHKVNEWINNDTMKSYLKPNTLFARHNFTRYLKKAKSK